MKTVSLLIGNSDNKLSQKEWSDFHEAVEHAVAHYEDGRQFTGCSEGCSPWQNACWVFTIDESKLSKLTFDLEGIRKLWKQDSVAIISGDTQFI